MILIKVFFLLSFRNDTLKIGTLVGVDKFGNRYYENNEYYYGTNRWVEYSDAVYLDYDGSQIASEWHAWMHYMTDIPPTKANLANHRWMIEHKPNLSGTKLQYVPYSTTRQKINTWKPKESLK